MSTRETNLPDWWQREKQRRQTHLLILLSLLGALIVFFYYRSHAGVTGITGSIDFDTSNTIAFIRHNDKGEATLYDVHADGTGLVALTPSDDTSDKIAPAWSLDGKQLYYASNRDDRKKMQIYVRGASEVSQLTYGTGRKENPFLTPDGKRIAFLTLGAVKTVLYNGNSVEQILPPPRTEGNSGADSAQSVETGLNGSYLTAAFASDSDGITGIAGVKELGSDNDFRNDPRLLNLNNGDQIVETVPTDGKLLTLIGGNAVSFAWEPGGKRLMVAYAESLQPIGDKTELVSGIMMYSFPKPGQVEGQPLMVSVGNNIEPRNLVWSPDGKKIAYETWLLKANKERQPMGIYVDDIPEKPYFFRPEDAVRFHATLPATAQGTPRVPRFSPDGSRLLFQVTRPNNKNDLFVINTDLTNATTPLALTNGEGDNTQAVWSPAKPK